MAAIIKLSQNDEEKFYLCKVSESRMAEFKMVAIIKLSQNEWVKFFLQNGWIQDDCHHQVKSEWITLNQIELVAARVLCKMAEFKMVEYKIAAIIKLSENEWIWVRLN